jgi:hypothetical protein
LGLIGFLRGLLADLLWPPAFIKIGAQLLLDPGKGFVAVAPVLDHKTGHRQHVDFAVSRVAEFEHQQGIKNPLAGVILV